MRILFLGDMVGRPGRAVVYRHLESVVAEHGIDFVIANGENASGGLGLEAKTGRELLDAGIDLLTSGNHIWRYRTVYEFLDSEKRIVRPANYPGQAPGRGYVILESGPVRIAVVNLQGRTFMEPIDCPFQTVDRVLDEIGDRARVIVVDFHAEATSEKISMGHYLDGRVSAVIGTHTHVRTADERVLPGGTAYLTDAGMCGPENSCLGMDKKPVLDKFLFGLPVRFNVAKGAAALNGAIVEVDENSGKAESITGFYRKG